MSATSKLVGFSATTGDDTDEVGQRVDVGRRRYLMRYVVGALGLAGLICVAAAVRVAMARSAAPQDDIIATLSTHPIALTPPPVALPAQAEPPPVVIGAPVAVAPVAAAAVAPASIVEAPAAARPAGVAPAGAARASAKPATAAAASPPLAHARAAAPSSARPQAHASPIIQSAPF